MEDKIYRGNLNLKNAGAKTSFTAAQIAEWIKITKDPVYFINTYCKVVHIDRGLVDFKLFPYQEQMVRHFHGMGEDGVVHADWRFSLTLTGRQMGKTTTAAAYILWFTITNKEKTSVILGNKASLAREILDRAKLMYEYLPSWMKPGILEWNKGRIKFDNKSQIVTGATSASAARGYSIALLYLDELSFVHQNIVNEFWTSTYPTISSGNESRVIISTTPNGYDFFYKLWKESEAGISEFRRLKFDWRDHPERDEKWHDTQLRNLGEEKFSQEFGAEFLGASNTLISSKHLYKLSPIVPLTRLLPESETLLQYYPPHSQHSYIMTVDVSRGADLDYSTFTVLDVSVMPYEVVCVYRDNTVNPQVYPEVISRIATLYNQAFVLIEINDLGQQVADILYYDLEYENVYMSVKDDVREGGDSKSKPGMRTTKSSKAKGCSALKALIEDNHLNVNDIEIINELGNFVRVGASYKADSGKHDDLVMCLVMFGYLTTQPVFKELFDFSLREKFFERQIKEVDDQMLPVGYMDRGDAPISSGNSWLTADFQENTEDFWQAFHDPLV